MEAALSGALLIGDVPCELSEGVLHVSSGDERHEITIWIRRHVYLKCL